MLVYVHVDISNLKVGVRLRVNDFDNEGTDYGHAHLSVAGKMINMLGKMRKHLVKLLRSCRVLLKAW